MPQSHLPRVTVIIPTHRRKNALAPALQSVLEQTFADFELLLVDDGSGADFAGMLPDAFADPRVKIIRNDRNLGPAAARNRGIAQARGEYIAFLDSDDVWTRDKLESQLDWMQTQPLRPRVCCTGYRVMTNFRPGGEDRTPNSVTNVGDLLWGCGLSPGSTMVVEKSVFDQVGVFDESLRRLEDWDWLLRCVQKVPIAVMPSVLATINAGERELFPLDDVRRSAARMKAYMDQGRYPLAGARRKTMLATLHSEVAAAAFRRRRYGLAVTSMLRSMYHNPFRRTDYYRRIFGALYADLKTGAGRSSQQS